VKIKFTLFIFIFVTVIYYSQEEINWYIQNTQISNRLYSVFFADSLNGWICGNQIILKTADGGNNWAFIIGTTDWREIFFLNDSAGLVGGSYRIAKSYDGGNTWTNKYQSSYRWIYDFYFIDTLTGLAVGGYNTILKTTDAGETLYLTNPPPVANVFLDAFFINDSIGWVSGLEDIGGPIRGLIAKTSDAGENWTVLKTFSYPETVIYNIHFFDLNFGICSSGGKLFKTTDGGINWTIQSTIPNFVENLKVFSDSIIWAVGRGIYNTTDLGLSWTTSFSDSSVYIRSIFFINDNLGWAVGDDGLNKGYILTTSKNIIVSTQDNFLKEKLLNLKQNYPNPFNPTTKINYQIPELSFVTLKVYDVLGNEIATLVSEEKPAGSYEVEFSAMGLPSGIYFYKLQAGSFIETKKMVLLK
jgi:photosystem II stability/assembly factor-like uncharacterized protein